MKHENIEVYLKSKVPSLKELHSKKSNGELKPSSTRLLANVMQYLQRWVCFFITQKDNYIVSKMRKTTLNVTSLCRLTKAEYSF